MAEPFRKNLAMNSAVVRHAVTIEKVRFGLTLLPVIAGRIATVDGNTERNHRNAALGLLVAPDLPQDDRREITLIQVKETYGFSFPDG